MNAKELRIGNLIQYEDFEDKICYQIVDGEVIERLWLGHGSEYYEPIELSEDILIKCGFKSIGFNIYTKQIINEVKLQIEDYSVIGIKNSVGYIVVNEFEKLYLHQLQNIFYCLTGKELEITL